MQKTIVFLLGLFLMVSCARESENSFSGGSGTGKYYLHYKLNGKQMKDEPFYVNGQETMLSRFEKVGNNRYHIMFDGLFFQGYIPYVTPRNYSYISSNINNDITNLTMQIEDPQTGETYFFYGWETTPDSTIKINITQVENSIVKGTFSAVILANNYDNPTQKKLFNITDGVFFIKLE